MTGAELRVKCEHLAPAGDAAAAAVLRLFADLERLKALLVGLVERVAAQGELLTRRAAAEPDRAAVLDGLKAGRWLGECALRAGLTGFSEEQMQRFLREHADMARIHKAVALVEGKPREAAQGPGGEGARAGRGEAGEVPPQGA
jgi:hypothetical protein